MTLAATTIDHILLRRAIATSVRVWPDEERTFGGKLLSDHPPVEATIELRLKATERDERISYRRVKTVDASLSAGSSDLFR